MSRVNFGTMTTEQTKEVVLEGLAELRDEDIIEIVTSICKDDEALLDELLIELQ